MMDYSCCWVWATCCSRGHATVIPASACCINHAIVCDTITTRPTSSLVMPWWTFWWRCLWVQMQFSWHRCSREAFLMTEARCMSLGPIQDSIRWTLPFREMYIGSDCYQWDQKLYQWALCAAMLKRTYANASISATFEGTCAHFVVTGRWNAAHCKLADSIIIQL